MQIDQHFSTFEFFAAEMKAYYFAQQSIRCAQDIRVSELLLGDSCQNGATKDQWPFRTRDLNSAAFEMVFVIGIGSQCIL